MESFGNNNSVNYTIFFDQVIIDEEKGVADVVVSMLNADPIKVENGCYYYEISKQELQTACNKRTMSTMVKDTLQSILVQLKNCNLVSIDYGKSKDNSILICLKPTRVGDVF